ncbi:MAG TPA: hypothetical protein VNM72_09410 [Blastocatellia bacterium]|nr:hypothetical protein [Blastocatellia bacterium]
MTPEEYWNQDPKHQDQKFYTAFCLLESACGDYAIGVDLYLQRKLNWACTVFYYSLVHAARLLCFLAEGDFPTGHSALGDLFTRGNVRGRTWLQGDIGRYLQETEGVRLSLSQFALDNLVACFSGENTINQCPDDLRRRFQRWGHLLSKARDLRNDSNYEGLLIAHEFNHQRVTRNFFRLASVLGKAAEIVLPEAIALFKLFIDSHPRREHWYAFLNWAAQREGIYYLEDSLRYKLTGDVYQMFEFEEIRNLNGGNWLRHRRNLDVQSGRCIVDRVLQWLGELRREPNANSDLAQQVHHNIVMGVFGAKSQLMHQFGSKIDKLEREIRGLAPGGGCS